MSQYTNVRRGLWLPALALLLLGSLVLGTMAPATTVLAKPALQGSTTVAVTPAQVSVQCQQETRVEIRINDVENLFGVDMRLSYDPNVVEVVDANTQAPGLQIQPGDRPDVSGGQGLVQTNTVDPTTGTINYAAIRLNPAPAQSGNGVIATITFRGLAAGTSPVSLVMVVLSDNVARPIQSTLTNGQITVTCNNVTPGTPVRPTVPTPGTPYHGGPTPTPTPYIIHPPTRTPGSGDGDGSSCRHIVKPGETLYSIARLYGVSAQAIAAANRLPNLNVIFAGTTLFIPGCGTGKPYPDITPVYPPDGKPGYPGGGKPGYPGGPGGYDGKGCDQYVVKPGETLSHIAMYTGDSVMAIAQRNKLINPNLVYAGQVLIVCHGGIGYPPIGYPPIGKPPIGQPSDPGYPPTKPGYGCRDVHIVKPYETLYHIALMYGSNVYAIAARNNIANPNLVFAGQPICIP